MSAAGEAPARVLLATRNAGKVREMRTLLAELGVALVGVDTLEADLGAAPEIAETGDTFAANALLKAKGYAAWAGLPVIAEDSGIEVDALGGAPGVHSARYAGDPSDDEANNRKLLAALADVPEAGRTARYRTVVVYLESPTADPLMVEGAWEGRIGHAPLGDGGFGYDPLFELPEHGYTAAQLPADEKNQHSHRGQAVRALALALKVRWQA